MKRVTPVVAVSAAVLGYACCSPALAYEESGPVADGGTVAGQIMFQGAAPMKSIVVNKDAEVCGASREEALLQVGPGGGVANTLVYLAEVPKGKPWAAAASTPELQNLKCAFSPDIQVIRPGAIAVVNKDPVLHNTHGYYGKRTAFNNALPNQDQSVTVELLKTGTVRVDCDAHGWMEGWVFVRDNPYYAVTGADGKFSIEGVPPGTYNLVALQPYSKLVQQPVTIAAGKSTDLSIELKPQ